MAVIPVDSSRMRLISGGSTVEEAPEYGELSNGERRRTGNQARMEDGRPVWFVYAFVPGDDGDRPEMVKIKIASHERPDPGTLAEVLELDGLAVMPYLDRQSGRVAMSWRADGVRVAGRKPQPVAS